MFAVVERELIPPLRWRDRLRKAPGWAVERVPSPRCVRLTLSFPMGAPEKELRRRASGGFGALARMGVTSVVLPEDFPLRELAAASGIAVAHPAPLYRRMAGRICEWAADEVDIAPSALHVALVGNRASGELLACAEHLRDRARRLTVSAGRDTDAVCYGLQKRLGVAAGQQAPGDADIILLFDRLSKPLHTRPGSLTVDLTGGTPAVSGGAWANGICVRPPSRLDALNFSGKTIDLLAALAASGDVRAGELWPECLAASGRILDLGRLRRGNPAPGDAGILTADK